MSLCVYPKTFVRHAVAAAVVVAALLLLSSAARAPSDSRTISGVVLDPDAKAVVDAVVMVRSEGASDSQSTTTDKSGHFSVSGLRPGAYTIEVAVPGFDLVRRAGVQLSAGRTEEVSIRLSV